VEPRYDRFTPRVTPLAERVDTADAALEFPPEGEPEDFVPARPAPRVPPAAPAIAVPRRGTVSVLHGARLLWIALAVGACAPIVWLALYDSDSAAPPQTAPMQTETVQTATVQTETASSPSARPPQDKIALAAAMPRRDPVDRAVVPPPAQRPPEPPRTIERRRARSRVDAPALVARAATPAAPLAVPSAPAASSAGFHGALFVVSEPAGARVFVNGRLVGETPLDLHDVPVGSRVVRVEADGYEAWATAIRVVANQQTRINAALRR